MAEFESTAPANTILPSTSEPTHSSKRALPNGPCNHRDPAFGTPCGCDQFWDNNNADVYDGSKKHRSSERSTWCVCGHHACMHAREAHPPVQRQPHVANTHNGVQAMADLSGQSQSGSQCKGTFMARSIRAEMPSVERGQPIYSARLKTSPPESNQLMSRQVVPRENIASLVGEARSPSSLPSSSGLPPVPSMCLLSHDRRPATDHGVRSHTSPSHQHISGLGLGLQMSFGNVGDATDRQPSVTSTVPDDINITRSPGRSHSEPMLTSAGANSMLAGHGHANSQGLGPLDQILQFNRNLHLTTGGDTIPNTYNPEEFIQSATEVATPSLAGTPDLRPVDRAVQDSKNLIDNLRRMASNQQGTGSERPGSIFSAPGPQLLLTNGPATATAQEQLEQAFRSASPRTINKLMAYLQPLHNVLISIPNVTNAIRELNDRMDLFESTSFNHIQPEDFQRQFEMMDGRQLELEHRMDDHDRLHQTIDQDHSTSSVSRHRLANATESFTSNHSIQSNTSSALIVSAIDRNVMETEMEGIKDRLDVLEAKAMPTSINPWEVEVVLLPWGRELRGIWFSEDQPMHDLTKTTTQDSEEWTQMRIKAGYATDRVTDSSPPPAARLSLKNSMPFSDTESGWSSQAISDWAAGSTDDWLSPKACGGTNQVYERLRSRGFVKDITLKSASAREVQATLSSAFSDLLEYLKYSDEEDDPFVHAHPGLRASFVPLRKVHKESKLRFLTPSEMASSALWTAQFLGAGIMMRVTGGKKRLYVTQRESYLQQPASLSDTWTWHDLRLLPRCTSDPDSQMKGAEEQHQIQVPEADALEPCWSFNANLDLPPPSVHSSFNSNSHHSTTAEIAMRPADRQWRRSITPSSILKNRAPQPISPLSENHPLRPSQGRLRTVSAPQVEVMQSSAKRRFNASPVKPSSVPTAHVGSRTPSASVSRLKRRRVAPSSSPRPEEMHDGVPVWANTPRRSRSPFFSSQPPLELRRTNSEASRGMGMGKGTPSAYATPHSGPVLGFGGGDTEPDSDDYQDDDGEKSWRGLEDDDDAILREGRAQGSPSFSGDESGFGSEDDAAMNDAKDVLDTDDDDGDDEDEYGYGGQRPIDSDDDDEDVYDTLLGVLESQ